MPQAMGTIDLKGKTALVTGASSGLGAAFARLLAARGADLVITARRAENLEALARELETAHRVNVTVIALDLSEPGAPAQLHAETEGRGRAVDILINNAGGGIHQNFADTPWEKIARQIQLNVVALTELTHLFVKAMLARGSGHVLNIASIGAYTPSPTYATYSAGKAFVRDFTEAVAYELRNTRVRVCCLCPGGTLTEFHLAAGHELKPIFKTTFMTAEACAAVGLSALFSGRRNVISGFVNKISMFMLRFVPRSLMLWMTALTMGEPRPVEMLLPGKKTE
jgi:short-subunit dehydrogenase